MRRKIVFIVLCALVIAGLFYLQCGREMTVNHITTERNPKGYSASVTITANKLVIINKKKYEKDLLQRVENNELPNMKLSYDAMGYPDELTITVYANVLMRALRISTFQTIEKKPYL